MKKSTFNLKKKMEKLGLPLAHLKNVEMIFYISQMKSKETSHYTFYSFIKNGAFSVFDLSDEDFVLYLESLYDEKVLQYYVDFLMCVSRCGEENFCDNNCNKCIIHELEGWNIEDIQKCFGISPNFDRK